MWIEWVRIGVLPHILYICGININQCKYIKMTFLLFQIHFRFPIHFHGAPSKGVFFLLCFTNVYWSPLFCSRVSFYHTLYSILSFKIYRHANHVDKSVLLSFYITALFSCKALILGLKTARLRSCLLSTPTFLLTLCFK